MSIIGCSVGGLPISYSGRNDTCSQNCFTAQSILMVDRPSTIQGGPEDRCIPHCPSQSGKSGTVSIPVSFAFAMDAVRSPLAKPFMYLSALHPPKSPSGLQRPPSLDSQVHLGLVDPFQPTRPLPPEIWRGPCLCHWCGLHASRAAVHVLGCQWPGPGIWGARPDGLATV